MKRVAALVLIFVAFSAAPASAAGPVAARYQLRGHLPELGEKPTIRVFQTQDAYDAYRTSLGDANVFPPSSSLFMSFDKDVLALYTRGNDTGGRCIATTMSFASSGDTVTGAFDWQTGTCGAPISAHYPFVLAAVSRTAADGSSWVTATRNVCAFVGTQDTNACVSLSGATSSPSPSPSPTAASPTPPPTDSPSAPDVIVAGVLIALGLLLGIAIMSAARRPRTPPSGFRRR